MAPTVPAPDDNRTLGESYLTRENLCAGGKTCQNGVLSATNPIRATLAMKVYLLCDKPVLTI
jgi:hypothetical protein